MAIRNILIWLVAVALLVSIGAYAFPTLTDQISKLLGFEGDKANLAVKGIIPNDFQGCIKCHPQIAEKMKAPNRHTPFVNGKCADCHKPHDPKTGKAEFVLPLRDLCSTCHNRYEERMNPYQHFPFKTGKCADCHDPHGSENTYNLRLDTKVLCNSCHNMALRYLNKKVQHPPFFRSECIACHHPHSSKNPRNLRVPAEELCNTCHFLTLPGQYALVKHPPFRDGKCIQCHHGHASDNERMLHKPVPDLCNSCHTWKQTGFMDKMHPIGTKFPDRALGGQVNCTSCHHPHGTGNNFMWRRPGNYLCFGCHRDKMNY
ncbi:MAG: cytochrome c3 family protein [Clostridia bacterium]|nr:cytochrome c3 family protein [Clostridia bacterium]